MADLIIVMLGGSFLFLFVVFAVMSGLEMAVKYAKGAFNW